MAAILRTLQKVKMKRLVLDFVLIFPILSFVFPVWHVNVMVKT